MSRGKCTSNSAFVTAVGNQMFFGENGGIGSIGPAAVISYIPNARENGIL